MKFKILRVIITAILLAILCACSAPAVVPASSETPEQTYAAASARRAEPLTGADMEHLLSCIADSGKPLESFPALITGADTSKNGCVLHIDRLEYNPRFEIGGLGDETLLINDSVKTEYIEIAEVFYANYVGRTVYDISPELLDYISGYEDGAQFTVFTLDGKVVFLSEITVP